MFAIPTDKEVEEIISAEDWVIIEKNVEDTFNDCKKMETCEDYDDEKEETTQFFLGTKSVQQLQKIFVQPTLAIGREMDQFLSSLFLGQPDKKEKNKKHSSVRRKDKKRETTEKEAKKLREKLGKLESRLSNGCNIIQNPLFLTPLPINVEFPPYWSTVSSGNSHNTLEEYFEVDLHPSSEEFSRISIFMNSNIGDHQAKYGCVGGKDPVAFQVTKVKRIQNLELWRRFEFVRTGIIKQNRYELPFQMSSLYLQEKPILLPQLDPHSNEYYLFHGTKWNVIDIVKKKGFDERVGSITGMFGAGIYLAENSSKSNQYIPCPQCEMGAIFTSGPCKCKNQTSPYGMLLCRVILGDVHIAMKYDTKIYKGTKEKPVRRPPSKSNNEELYDSVMGESKLHGGDTLNYREFIVYDRLQVYPEYVIYFNRIGPTTQILTEQ